MIWFIPTAVSYHVLSEFTLSLMFIEGIMWDSQDLNQCLMPLVWSNTHIIRPMYTNNGIEVQRDSIIRLFFQSRFHPPKSGTLSHYNHKKSIKLEVGPCLGNCLCWISQQRCDRTVPNLVAACPEDLLMECVFHGMFFWAEIEQCKIVTLFNWGTLVSNCHIEM